MSARFRLPIRLLVTGKVILVPSSDMRQPWGNRVGVAHNEFRRAIIGGKEFIAFAFGLSYDDCVADSYAEIGFMRFLVRHIG